MCFYSMSVAEQQPRSKRCCCCKDPGFVACVPLVYFTHMSLESTHHTTARVVAGFAGLQRALAAVPSAVFSPNVRGKPKYSAPARASCLGVKFLEYSLAGMICGFIGQGMANGMMRIKCARSSSAL